ncbi:MAG: prolipoprotein diacylglyceryl transferase [Anaerolineae bacterium]|nr:prolipoprotein diacylglyceryl transferase [Anaerolineae bacterium]
MAPYLRIFGFTVQAYGLLILAAVWIGLEVASRRARRLGLNSNQVYNLVFYALVATVLGARLVYVVTHWSAYRGALLSALSLTPTALSWPEGALIGGVVAIIYWSRRRLPVGATLDALAPGLVIALTLERLGAFLDGRDFGEPTTMPWGVYLWDAVRHPVQLYEMIALLVIFGMLWWQEEREHFDIFQITLVPFRGYIFTLFVALYAGSRLFLEAFYANTSLLPGGIRTAQVVALVVLLGAVWYLYRRRFAASKEPVTEAAGKVQPH